MSNKISNITAAPVTAKTFPIHLENYLRKNDLVILPRMQLVKMTEALGVFGVALEILGQKGLLDMDAPIAGNSAIEIAKK